MSIYVTRYSIWSPQGLGIRRAGVRACVRCALPLTLTLTLHGPQPTTNSQRPTLPV
jgi:hypothetical protein